MVTHRRTPSRSNRILPGWFFVLSAVLSVAAAAALVLLVVERVDDSASASGSPSASSTGRTADPGPGRTSSPDGDATPSPTPSQSESPTPGPTATPTVDRTQFAVVVLNGTTTPGLATAASARVQQIGWPSAGVGNWRGPVPATTVYYPAGQEAAGRQLAADLGVASVAPSLAGMNTQRLTIVVLSSLG